MEKLARKTFGAIKTDKEILRIFWDGLKIDIRKFTVSASPTNLQEALQTAQKAGNLLAGSRKIKEISTISEVQVSSIKHRNARNLIATINRSVQQLIIDDKTLLQGNVIIVEE